MMGQKWIVFELFQFEIGKSSSFHPVWGWWKTKCWHDIQSLAELHISWFELLFCNIDTLSVSNFWLKRQFLTFYSKKCQIRCIKISNVRIAVCFFSRVRNTEYICFYIVVFGLCLASSVLEANLLDYSDMYFSYVAVDNQWKSPYPWVRSTQLKVNVMPNTNTFL